MRTFQAQCHGISIQHTPPQPYCGKLQGGALWCEHVLASCATQRCREQVDQIELSASPDQLSVPNRGPWCCDQHQSPPTHTHSGCATWNSQPVRTSFAMQPQKNVRSRKQPHQQHQQSLRQVLVRSTMSRSLLVMRGVPAAGLGNGLSSSSIHSVCMPCCSCSPLCGCLPPACAW